MEQAVVRNFDITQYLGKWYEIARIDYPFERNMYAVTLEYSMRPDGAIRVVQTGHRGNPNGKQRRTLGKARLGAPNDMTRPGYLKISYFPLIYKPYYILAMDEDYTYALVGGKNHKYLWILARDPEMPEEKVQELLVIAEMQGYKVSDIKFVK